MKYQKNPGIMEIEVDEMIYECKNPVTHIVGVEHLTWKADTFHVLPRDYAGLAFRINGTATITVSGKPYIVNASDVLYLPQGVSYHAQYSDTEIFAIHFKTLAKDGEPEVYTFDNAEPIYKAFLKAHLLWQNKAPGFHAYVQAQLYAIFGLLCESKSSAELPACFLKAVSFINVNYKKNDLNIDMVCNEARISATAFRQLFKKFYGKSPVEYITALRLEYARNLISGGMPVENAAYQSGFNDPKYFARVVKKHFGCTPRALKSYGK